MTEFLRVVLPTRRLHQTWYAAAMVERGNSVWSKIPASSGQYNRAFSADWHSGVGRVV